MQGLEAQLLGTVVREERPDLEEQKDNLVISIASGRKQLQELEDEILRWDIRLLRPQQGESVASVWGRPLAGALRESFHIPPQSRMWFDLSNYPSGVTLGLQQR